VEEGCDGLAGLHDQEVVVLGVAPGGISFIVKKDKKR